MLLRILNRFFVNSFVGILVNVVHFLGFGIDSPPVLVPERSQWGFLFIHDSSNGIHICFFFLLAQCFVFVCLRYISHCHVVFGSESLAFLYLLIRLLW